VKLAKMFVPSKLFVD